MDGNEHIVSHGQNPPKASEHLSPWTTATYGCGYS